MTTADSDASVVYAWTPQDGTPSPSVTELLHIDMYKDALAAGYARVRAIDRTGNASAWATGPANINNASYVRLVTGDMSNQNDDAVEVTGITTGGGISTPEVLVRAAVNTSGTLTGGSPSEIVDVSLTSLGFSTKPDGPSGGNTVSTNNLLWRYDWDSASSTSTNARIVFFSRDGTNIGASDPYRLQTEFYEI